MTRLGSGFNRALRDGAWGDKHPALKCRAPSGVPPGRSHLLEGVLNPTGMRLMDAVNLRWCDVDRVERVISFEMRKTRKHKARTRTPRSAGRHKDVIGLHEDFADWLKQRPIPIRESAHIFPELVARANSGLSMEFIKLIERAGIANPLIPERSGKGGRSVHALSFHSFRHSTPSTIYNAQIIKQKRREQASEASFETPEPAAKK